MFCGTLGYYYEHGESVPGVVCSAELTKLSMDAKDQPTLPEVGSMLCWTCDNVELPTLSNVALVWRTYSHMVVTL